MGTRKKLSENEILEQVHDHSGSEIDFSDEENEEIIYFEKQLHSEILLSNSDEENIHEENIDEEIMDDEEIIDYPPTTSGVIIHNFEIIEAMPSTSSVGITDNNSGIQNIYMPSTSGIQNNEYDIPSISGAFENDDDDSSMPSDNEINNSQIPISACISTVRRVRTRGGIQRGGTGVPRRRGVRIRGGRWQRARGAQMRGHRGAQMRGHRGAQMRGPRGRGRGPRAPIDLFFLEQIDKDLGWSADDIPPPTLPDFTGDAGIKVPLDQTSTELDCFKIFFTEDILKNIKSETNKYAYSLIQELKRKNLLKKNSIWNKWKPTTIPELKGFFAIIIHMGLVKKPEICDYWSKDPVLHTPFAAKVMSRDRFKMILNALHLNDNRTYIPKGQPNHDPIHKIRPFWDTLLQKCSSSFYPNCDLTIDEGMVAFRGRVSFKVYNKNKPDKYGIKLYMLCDAQTGYVVNMEVYTGKGIIENTIIALLDRLLQNQLGKGHTVYLDRFYSSPQVFDHLFVNNTLAVGTCMPNRKEFPKIFVQPLQTGDFIFRRRNALLAIKWHDKRDVYALSTKHMATRTWVGVRSKQGVIEKEKPDLILDYNMNKTGVDRNDQMNAYYPFKRKTLKWWKKVFFRLFMMSLVNSFILFKMTRAQNQATPLLAKYLRALCTNLADMSGADTVATPTTSKTDRLTGRHFIRKIPATPKKMHPTRVCLVCKEKGKPNKVRKETAYYCPQCNVPLCVDNCFEVFHTKANFSL